MARTWLVRRIARLTPAGNPEVRAIERGGDRRGYLVDLESAEL
ncbi:hypothetical protein [Actinoplanes derwentensis]|nr:hypothetical protein [Actinoplanes derwentensis]GID83725.1 hypothetical protein Ade03nite_26490 [Actinoplanes derwentensis]